jgi:uncharacterized protein YfaS (alpha-2-macroglobulin family)
MFMNKRPFLYLYNLLGSFFTFLFGKITWKCPSWLSYLRLKIVAHPRVSGVFLGLIILTGFGYHWYKGLPQPRLVTASITQPQITPVAKVLVPDVLIIDFGIKNGEFAPKSVAPLKQIGKDIPAGISMKPAMPGKWNWQTDSRLVFTPSQDWPAGQVYSIHLDKNVLAPGVKVDSLNYTFATRAFQASIAEFKFYQDPVNPQLKQAVATVNFNYPVDSSSFESKTSLILQAMKDSKLDLTAQHYKLSFTYDDNKRIAYLHSESIPLPDTTRYLKLNINYGVKAATGSASTEDSINRNVVVPDAASYFKVSHVSSTIVRDPQDRPEQILSLETTLGVTDAELTKSLHVYLLPQDYPATSAEEAKPDYAWQNPGEVTDNILKLATPVNLQAVPVDRDYATLHSYKISAPATRFMYIKLDKGVHAFGNFELANDYAVVVQVPAYPKEIGFLHKGALLALSSEKKLSVLVRGVEAVKFQIARVLPDDVNQLITQTEGDFNNPRFINQSFNQDNISEIFSEIQHFSNDPAKEQYTALNLGKYLSTKTNTNGPQGLFLLQATGWDTEKNLPLEVKSSRLILMTDLGLVVKDNSDGSHDLFVQSITKGVPVAGVSVSILGKNGVPVLTRITDAQGRANFPTLKDFTDEREPTVYLAKLASDVSFIPFNNPERQLNFSRYDIGGIYSNPELQTLSAYLFSDRGIYRPGDMAHIGMIIKQVYAQMQPAGLPLEVTVTDPKGVVVQDKKLTLDATGLLAFDLPTTPTSPTGTYTISLFIVKDNHQSSLLGSSTIRVADFLPDRMKITSHLSTEQSKGWISPSKLSAKVGLWNLYGAPAVDRKVTAKIVLAPQRIQFKEYPDYTFVDPLLDPAKPQKVFTDTLTDAHTDSNGFAQFDLNLDRFDKATYELTFSTEGFEAEGGRSVAAQSTALVSPLAYFIGYKPDGNLSYIKQNSQRSINLIVVNPELKQQAMSNLKIQLASLHPVSTLVKNADGTFQYQSVIQTSVVSTTPFSVEAKGSNYMLPTQQIGDFMVTVLDQNNTELSKFKYTVAGVSQLPLSKNAELSVKLNKTEYLPNEEIELEITAPYTGTGLITLERDKVYATQWFKTDTTSSVQKIRVPKDFRGNGYVNVTFVRNWDSPEIFVSPLSFSIVPFSVNHEDQAIHINLITDATARPGEAFTIKYKTDKPGKMIVFAVDEGILQVAAYKTPDPLGYFFQKHALEVLTQQTVDQILPKFIQDRELSAVGGDGGEEALRSHLNPFKRKTDLPVVYWSGIVDTDTTERQLVYQIPDYFNGTLRVMAIAVAENALGSTEKSSEIKGDFVINPNVPTFVAPGDEFEITASIANNVKGSGKDAKVDIQLAATSQLEIVGGSNHTLLISEGQESTVKYKIRAKNLLGAAQLDFVARLGDKSGKMNATLSVRPASENVTTVDSGFTSDSNKSLVLSRELYPEYRHVVASISTSPLILLVGLQRYLENFPYGCTEQLVSKAFPLVVSANQAWLIGDRQLATNKIEATVQMLGQRQMSNGGFSYWPNMGEYSSNTFASVYAMHFLTEAKAQGYDVPVEMFRSGLGYLKELAQQNVTDLGQARIQAYAIYILTRNEVVTTNYLTNLQLYLDHDKHQAWKQDIIGAYIAATYQLLKSDKDANRLIGDFKVHADSDVNDTNFYDSNIADAQYLYLLARHFPDRLQKQGQELVMPLVKASNSGEINTVLSSYTSLALSAYAQSFQTVNNAVPLSVTEILPGKEKKVLASSDNAYVKVDIDESAKEVSFNNASKQTYFYQLTQSGFDKKFATAMVKHDLEVFREYHDLKGNVIDHAGLGDEVEVHIRIRALDNHYLSNVAIVDLLPGGFEVVNDSVKPQNMDYADAREDRVNFFGAVNPQAVEVVYRIKAVNKGKFTAPPVFAASMYDPAVNAQSATGSMLVDK